MTIRPPAPHWLDQIQFMKFWAMSDCDSPFALYIETALPIAGRIATQLLTLGGDDLIKNLIRPSGGRGGRHGRRGNKSGRKPPKKPGRRGAAPGIPEPADLIGDRLDPHKDLRPTNYSMGGRALFIFHDIWERALYTLFLGEAIDDLTWGAIIGMAFNDERPCPNIGRFYAENGHQTITSLFNWLAIHYSQKVYSNHYASTTTFGATPLNGKHVFVFAGECVNDDINEMPAAFLFRMLVNGNPTEPEQIDLDYGDVGAWCISAELNAGDHVQWEARLIGGATGTLKDIKFMGIQVDE